MISQRASRNVRLLGWFNFWTDFRPYAPIAILYFARISGSYALGMSIFATTRLAQSLFEVPGGVFSDRVGRKLTIVAGAVASVLSLVCYAIGGTYIALLAGAIFEGLARALYSGNNDAFLYDTLAESGQEEAFGEYLGRTSSMYQSALAISALVGSLIAAISFPVVLWLSVIPMALALLVSLRFDEPPVHTHASTNLYAHLGAAFRNIIRNPRLRLLSLASILGFAIGEATWLFRSAFVERLWPVWALGVAQMIANVSAAASFYFAGRLIRRFGAFNMLVGGMFTSNVTHLFAVLVPTVFSPALMSLTSIFFGVNTVASGALIQREFTNEQRATMGSLNSFAGSLLFALFAYLLGALADRIDVAPALAVAMLASFIPMLLYARALRKAR